MDAHSCMPGPTPAPNQNLLCPILLPLVAEGALRLQTVFTQQRDHTGETGASAKATAKLIRRRCNQVFLLITTNCCLRALRSSVLDWTLCKWSKQRYL